VSELLVSVLTCSDQCAAGASEDAVGRAVVDACIDRSWDVVAYDVCPGDVECVVASLIDMTDVEEVAVVLTVGGTGLGRGDVVPEATEKLGERCIPGIPEAIRSALGSEHPGVALSRCTAYQRGETLIVNLPRQAALEAFETVADRLESAVESVVGSDEE
jgi:molybdenum cofactor synthesis domain-containing protein